MLLLIINFNLFIYCQKVNLSMWWFSLFLCIPFILNTTLTQAVHHVTLINHSITATNWVQGPLVESYAWQVNFSWTHPNTRSQCKWQRAIALCATSLCLCVWMKKIELQTKIILTMAWNGKSQKQVAHCTVKQYWHELDQ